MQRRSGGKLHRPTSRRRAGGAQGIVAHEGTELRLAWRRQLEKEGRHATQVRIVDRRHHVYDEHGSVAIGAKAVTQQNHGV
jgi:hypothetical protein